MLRHKVLFPWFLTACSLTLLVGLLGGSFWWFFFALIIAIGITAWGAFDIRLGYFVHTFFRKKHNAERVIALTFDDGPSIYTPEILRLLATYQFKASFFCIGKQVSAHQRIAKQIIAEGHTLGNHSYTHSKNFGFFNEKDVVAELERCDAIVQQMTDQKPRLFRPPFGVTNPSIAKAVQYTKHQVIGWSNRSLDTVIWEEDTIYERVCKKLKSGDIILFHDTSPRTVNVLKRLLPQLHKQGYISVSVDDLLNLHAYEQ